MMLEQRQYPIGKFAPKADYRPTEIAQFIKTIEDAPAKYQKLVVNLSEADLAKTYREGAWTIQQLVHHVADMQLIHFHRFKVTITEQNPQGSVVNIDGWANTPDAIFAPIAPSLAMFESTKIRFMFLVNTLNAAQWELSFHHATRKIDLTLKQAIYMSAWHVEHHYQHIKIALGIA